MSEKREVVSSQQQYDDDRQDEYQCVEADGQQVIGTCHSLWGVAYQQEIVYLLRVLLQQQEDAEQEDIERQGTDDKSYNEDDADDDTQKVGGTCRFSVIRLRLIAVIRKILCDPLVGRIADSDYQPGGLWFPFR